MHHVVDKEKSCQICTLCLISLHFTCLGSPLQWNRKMPIINKSHWNILVFCNHWKLISDLNMSYGKIPDFVSFPLFEFTVVIKPEISILKVIEIL